MLNLKYSILALLAGTLTACGVNIHKSDKASTPIEFFAAGSMRFEPNFHLERITTYEEYRKAIDSYWDSFDFTADTLVTKYDKISVVEALADYVAFIEPQLADSLLRQLIHRAEASRAVLDLFVDASVMVLHDPNSPLRNDEYYIPILEELIVSPLMDEYDRIIFEHDLSIARKNRWGETATDFVYTMADGRKGRLSDIKARYTLIMFNNPDCNMCANIIHEIDSSPLLNTLIDAGQLCILSLYPDADLEAWHKKLATMPTAWIVAYDDGMQITQNELYDLRAIPSLYLLDNAKRVIIKDGTNVGAIEAAVSR